MKKSELIALMDQVAHLDKDEMAIVIACAEFHKYIQENLGEPINLTTAGYFSSMVGKLIDTMKK